jgi:lipopolysaccharide transport system permease protein
MSSGTTTTVYQPVSGWQLINVQEIWKFRELLWYFAWRDVKVRYKQTAFGAGWAILQPFMMMVVFSVFFGQLAGVASNGIPYPVFVYAGLVLWTFFANSITASGNSVVSAGNVVTKVYFPRLIVPFASVGAAALDFLIASSLLLALMLWYGMTVSTTMLLLPLPFVVTVFAGLGVGVFLAALNVSFRDFRYTIPFLVQLWMFSTPTVYMEIGDALTNKPTTSHAQVADAPTENTPTSNNIKSTPQAGAETGDAWASTAKRCLYIGNPMTGIIAFFRSAALGDQLPWRQFAISSSIVGIVFVSGLLYFRRVESRFADII